MVRSRTRKLRPKAPVFPFAKSILNSNSTTENQNQDQDKDKDADNQNNEDCPLPLSPIENKKETTTDTQNKLLDESDSNKSLTNELQKKNNNSKNTTLNHHDSICFLKIIGSIQSGQKLSQSSNNPSQPFSIDPNQWSSSFSRWWNGDSRSLTVKILRERFDSVFKNIDEAYQKHINRDPFLKDDAFNRSPKDILLDYARELSGAEKGLRHLSHTYKRDIPITSELQVMLESVQIRKQTIDNMFTIKDN